jgi:protein gp37
VHAHVFGRPTGMWAFDRVMKIAKKAKDVWIGTRAEAAAHVRKVLKIRRSPSRRPEKQDTTPHS